MLHVPAGKISYDFFRGIFVRIPNFIIFVMEKFLLK